MGGILCPCDVNAPPETGYNVCPHESGPADCINNICWCKTGFCSYWVQVTSKSPIKMERTAGHHCLARMIGRNCRRPSDCITPGAPVPLCINGACMCVYNSRYDPTTGVCVIGWDNWPPAPAANTTYETSLIAPEHLRYLENHEALAYIPMVVSFVAAAVAVAIVGAKLVRCKFLALLRK